MEKACSQRCWAGTVGMSGEGLALLWARAGAVGVAAVLLAGCAALQEASSVGGGCEEAVRESYTVESFRQGLAEDPATAEWAEQLTDEQLAGFVDDPEMMAFEWALCVSEHGWTCDTLESQMRFEMTGDIGDVTPPRECTSSTGSGSEAVVPNPFL